MRAPIKTPRLVLLPVKQMAWMDEDTERLVNWLNDPELMKYSEQRHRVHTLQSQQAYLKYAADPYWAITIEDGFMIGTIKADIDYWNDRANLGILIGDRAYQGKGLGTEAWGAAMRHLAACGIRKFEAGMMAANERMIKTCLACGMAEEGRIKEHFIWNGEPMDLVLMGEVM